MPTTGGPKDAIAVQSNVADQLNSAYTFMVQLIILSFWALLILAGLILYLGKTQHSHNSGVISAGIWNAKGSPFDVFKLTTTYFIKVKDRRRWLLLLWMLLALGILVANFAIPIKVAPYIILSNAAPVRSDAIYVPSLNGVGNAFFSKTYGLEVPSALRAAGSVQVANSSTRARVSVDQPITIPGPSDGETNLQMGYRYNVTGVDFGLQRFPDLVLIVEGSCRTEYSWLVAESRDDFGYFLDEYWPFDDPTQAQNVSFYDSARPIGYFMPGSLSPTGPPGNQTWGAIISAVQRQSYSAGTDPWYLTVPSGDGNSDVGYRVKGGRPALSCWQNDVWSYHGSKSTILGLNSTVLPGLDMPDAMQSVFARFLGEPKIVPLATRLGASALLSAATALGEVFDAGSSSVHAELERLVFASYIASINVLTDTVLFPTEHNDIPNVALGPDGQIIPGVDGFVVWSSEVRTLSVRVLIIIPVIALAMFLIVYCLTSLPSPWYRIQALQATVLYSWAHEKASGNPNTDLRHEGELPYVKNGDVEQAVFRPHFDRHSRTLSWTSNELRQANNGIAALPSPTENQAPRANGTTTLSSMPTSPVSPTADEKFGRTSPVKQSVLTPRVLTPPASEVADPILAFSDSKLEH